MQDEIDYSTYTLSQLRDVERHIDRTRYPERAEIVKREVQRRVEAGEADPSDEILRSPYRNPLLLAGIGVIALAVGQFAVAGVLDALNWIDIGNGLGHGLLMVFGGLVGTVLMACGAILQSR